MMRRHGVVGLGITILVAFATPSHGGDPSLFSPLSETGGTNRIEAVDFDRREMVQRVRSRTLSFYPGGKEPERTATTERIIAIQDLLKTPGGEIFIVDAGGPGVQPVAAAVPDPARETRRLIEQNRTGRAAIVPNPNFSLPAILDADGGLHGNRSLWGN